MKTNVGSLDRILRIVLGLAVLGAGLYFKNLLGLIGLVPLLTAVIGFCPVYPLLGLNTCPREKAE